MFLATPAAHSGKLRPSGMCSRSLGSPPSVASLRLRHFPPDGLAERGFEFQRDTFAFPNELVWVYEYDANGKWTPIRATPNRPTGSIVRSRPGCEAILSECPL